MQYEATPLEADIVKALAGSDALGAIGNLLGLPALCVPCGFGARHLPVGMVMVGPRRSEADLLQLGEVFQARTTWARERPPM
jgi:Asp-tRNA(Asn)/Glu-tRNA(Gln) amidotransferase A subunit family amidase